MGMIPATSKAKENYMASVTTFIRNTPVASLRTYFDTTGIELPTPMNWDADAPDVIRPLLQAVDEMDEDGSVAQIG